MERAYVVLAVLVQGLGIGETGDVHGGRPLGIETPWWLLLSCALCSLAFFLLHQSEAVQRWAWPRAKNAPDPKAGVTFAYMASVFLGLAALAFLYVQAGAPEDFLLSAFLLRPNTLLPVPLLIGIPPAGVATFKFAAAVAFRRPGAAAPMTRRVAVLGVVFSAIQLVSSIITIAVYLGSR